MGLNQSIVNHQQNVYIYLSLTRYIAPIAFDTLFLRVFMCLIHVNFSSIITSKNIVNITLISSTPFNLTDNKSKIYY